MITILRNNEITDRLVFEMKEDEIPKGSVTAVLSDDGDLVITDLESEQEIYYDGLCRSVLAYAVIRGVNRAIFSITDERKLKRLKGFGFISDGSNVMNDIGAFFEEDNCK